MSQFLTDEWNKQVEIMQEFFVEMDEKIENARQRDLQEMKDLDKIKNILLKVL